MMSKLKFPGSRKSCASIFSRVVVSAPLLLIFPQTHSFAAEAISASNWSASDIHIAEARLVDIEGRPVDFARDVIADRIVAINFIYSSCRTLCPFSSAIFNAVQERLGNRLGKDVWLISLTLDPATDTPARLEAFAEQFEPKRSWLWLTGALADMDAVLKGLGVSAANFKEHAPLILVGDAKFGRWTRLNATPSAAQVEGELNRLWAARETSAAAAMPVPSAQTKAAAP